MNELTPLTRARVYVQDLINGRMGDWCGYSNSQQVRTHAKVSGKITPNEWIELDPADRQKECMTA